MARPRRMLVTAGMAAPVVVLVLSACGPSADPSAGNNLPNGPGRAGKASASQAGQAAPGQVGQPAPGQASKQATGQAALGQVGVVAAENFWGNIAQQIGGDTVRVTSIISDPESDPHQYETNARDGAAIAGASFVIENGAGYDPFVDKLLKASPKSGREVLTVAAVVGASSDANPHLWYNPMYVTKAARAIEAELERQDRANAGAYRANLARFGTGEQRVIDVIDQIEARHAGDKIAYTERVPGYLTEAAGLQLGTPASFAQSIEDGNDPSPADNAAFQLALKKHKVKVLLYNAQVTSPTTQKLKSLAKSSGIPTVGVTETLPPNEKDFQTWQADQARALLSALGG